MQDSVFKLKDVSFEPKHGQFSLSANRFVWESTEKKSLPPERCRSVVFLKRVSAAGYNGEPLRNKAFHPRWHAAAG